MRAATLLAVHLLIAGSLLVSGCAAGDGSSPAPAVPGPTEPVPMASLSAGAAAAAAAIQRGLGAAGFRVEHVNRVYRPGEPQSLRFAPRALLQVALTDPDTGWIVVYDLGTPDRAEQAARDMVAYLQSGFGQTNFPADAQFAVNQLDGTIFFSWWSRERSSEPERARAAFEALRLVGIPYPIVR